jgi:hypothetical protein
MSDAIEPEVVEQNTEPQKVTASLSTEVSFNPQVADADTAIKNRNTATKNARAKWVALADFMAKYDVNLSRRRGNVDDAYRNISSVKVYKARTVTDEELEKLRAVYEDATVLGDNHRIRNLLDDEEGMAALETKFQGLEAYLRGQMAEYRKARKAWMDADKTPGQDKKATVQVREEATKLADEFARAMEELEDSADVLTGVREYIGVVESIANISAAGEEPAPHTTMPGSSSVERVPVKDDVVGPTPTQAAI